MALRTRTKSRMGGFWGTATKGLDDLKKKMGMSDSTYVPAPAPVPVPAPAPAAPAPASMGGRKHKGGMPVRLHASNIARHSAPYHVQTARANVILGGKSRKNRRGKKGTRKGKKRGHKKKSSKLFFFF